MILGVPILKHFRVTFVMLYGPLALNFGQICMVKVFVRGRFKGSYYCSILKFCLRIYIYKCNRNIQESGCDDSYAMVH